MSSEFAATAFVLLMSIVGFTKSTATTSHFPLLTNLSESTNVTEAASLFTTSANESSNRTDEASLYTTSASESSNITDDASLFTTSDSESSNRTEVGNLFTTSANESSNRTDNASLFTTSASESSNRSEVTSFLGDSSSELNLWHYLPRKWSSICTIDYSRDRDVNATISCQMTAGSPVQWRLADLRTALSALVNSSKLEVAVRLQCQTGCNISLPFPMRAPGLVKLTVRNCRLLDKYGDFATPAQYLGDWLRELDMRDCTWINDPKDLESLLKNLDRWTSDYECGQDGSLISYIYRNISDGNSPLDLLDSESGLDSLLGFNQSEAGIREQASIAPGTLGTDNHTLQNVDPGSDVGSTASPPDQAASGSATLEDLLDTLIKLDGFQSSCNYVNLEVQDESYSPIINKNHFEFMVKNSKFPKLRLLNYTAIGLTEVPQELRESRRKFPGSQLGVIDLSHNYVRELGPIPPYPARGIPLKIILQFNNITDISMGMFEEWAMVSEFYVDIRNNPIDCNCGLNDLLRQMQNQSKWEGAALTSYKRDLSVMKCATPPPLLGRAIGTLSANDLPCPVSRADLRPAMAVLVVIVCILLVLLALAIKFRKEVRILLYTRVHILLPCGPGPASSCVKKMYDAFVSYAHSDSDWVLDSLLKRLEDSSPSRGCGPCKLCIHQRDFVVGKPIIDNIIDSIAASRHTIVILSKNFVQSSWAMEELQHAYRQSLEERRRHLVVVVLEDVPEADMAPVLRRCCKTFTYLHVKDSLFWDRLLYSLHVDDCSSSQQKIQEDTNTSPMPDGEYDSISDIQTNKDRDEQQEQGEIERSAADEEFRTAIFLETMRTISVDSTCTTVSETGFPVTPSQLDPGRPLFESRA